MAGTIKITPEELRDAADFLNSAKEEIIGKVKDISDKINQTADDGWEGAAKSAFVEGFQNMEPLLKEDFPSVITGLEEQLKAAADALEQTDAEIASAFRG